MFVELTYQGKPFNVNVMYIVRFVAVGEQTHLFLRDGSLIAVEENYCKVKKIIDKVYN